MGARKVRQMCPGSLPRCRCIAALTVLGLLEGEAWDRGDIQLCGQQQAILETALKPGKPLVSVMINGGSIAATWIKEHSAAVLEAWYPGQAGGEAVAAVLFGEHSPGGRLPVTIYDETLVVTRNITDMSLRSAEGLTCLLRTQLVVCVSVCVCFLCCGTYIARSRYMHYTGTPLWPFGTYCVQKQWSLSLSLFLSFLYTNVVRNRLRTFLYKLVDGAQPYKRSTFSHNDN